MKLIYLASPYSHDDATVREARFHEVLEAAAHLMNQGQIVYSPIAHNHPIAVAHTLPTGWDYWQSYDEVMLGRCDRLYVLMTDGWGQSQGIAGEIAHAKKLGLPVFFLTKEADGFSLVEAASN